MSFFLRLEEVAWDHLFKNSRHTYDEAVRLLALKETASVTITVPLTFGYANGKQLTRLYDLKITGREFPPMFPGFASLGLVPKARASG